MAGKQHQITLAGRNLQAVLHPQVLPVNANRIAIAVGFAIARPGKVKVQQQRLNHGWATGLLTPALTLVGHLLQNEQVIKGPIAYRTGNGND
jgi:hypothetical protein